MDEIMKLFSLPPELDGIGRALFIQPHPDDNEIGAGGLMVKLVSSGTEVWELTVTDDRLDCSPEDFQDGFSLRQREAHTAMETIGVKDAGFLGFADKTDATVEDIAAAIVPIIRKLRPDAVFSVDPTLSNECHRDHIKIGWAVRYAVMDAECDFFPRLPDRSRHSDVWRVNILGQYFTSEPNIITDIGAFWDKKIEAVSCHASQVTNELLMALDLQSRYFGSKAGCERAEALKTYSFLQIHCFNLPIGRK